MSSDKMKHQNDKAIETTITDNSSLSKSAQFNYIIIAIVVLLIGLGFIYWYGMTQLSDLDSANADLHAQLQQTQQTTQSTIKDLQTQVAAQQKTLVVLQDLSKGSVPAWRIAEAKYLVQLANYQIVFAHDPQAALALLQTAGQRLATVDDPNLIGARQQIANSVAALQALPKVDLADLLTRITALQTQATSLPAIGLPPSQMLEPQFEQAESASPVKKAVKDTWTTLQKIVVIRKHDQAIQPLLSPEQQSYLQQNLQLILQQAQWAALRGKDDVYKVSLKQAQIWVQKYFARNMPATQAFAQALADLQKINVEPVLPNLTALVQSIKQINIAPPVSTSASVSAPAKKGK